MPDQPERVERVERVERSVKQRSLSLPRDTNKNKRAPGKIHTIQTLTRESSKTGSEREPNNTAQSETSKMVTERQLFSSMPQQPQNVANETVTRRVVTQQNLAPITQHGNTTITFSGPNQREETYVNKVFQQNDQPAPKKQPESFASGVIQVDEVQKTPVTPTIPVQRPNDLHLTRINIHNTQPLSPPDHHHTTINLKHMPAPEPKPEVQPEKKEEVKAVKTAVVEKPKKKSKKKNKNESEEYIEEVYIQRAAPVESESEDETTKTTKKTKVVRMIELPHHLQPRKPKEKSENVEEFNETSIQQYFADMTPDKQKTFQELTKTALGRTEQTASNLFSSETNRGLITEAWNTNRPKTEQEIIEELSSKTTSEVVRKSLLEGMDFNLTPTHSKELEEIQRKRREFESAMERQRKIREIKAGIRQNIHVDHNEEELIGDYQASLTEDGQIDMDTVEEHVDLGINENGVAAIAVKVTAERILPVNIDKKIWRKSSVTVTRTIEIDLMRCEETRILYEKILNAHKDVLRARAEEAARLGHSTQPVTQQLDASDTYKIFATLMNATGEGNEDLGILSGAAAKHFLSGNYVKDPYEKQMLFDTTGGLKSAQTGSSSTRTTKTTKQSHSSINPESFKSERSSEYYKQRSREQSPPPEFGSRMFDGRKVTPRFSSDYDNDFSTDDNMTPVHEVKQFPVQHERSVSPSRFENQKHFVNQHSTSSQRRQRSPERRLRFQSSDLELSPPRYTSRERQMSPRRYSEDEEVKSRSLRPTGSQLLYTERVKGVKQQAADRRNKESSRSSDELDHYEREDRQYSSMPLRRKTVSHDDLLYGGNDYPPNRSGGYMEQVQEERYSSSHQSNRRPDVEHTRADMLGINGDRQKGYESGYYSEQGNTTSKPSKSDITQMLADAERYFRKTFSEYELDKLNEPRTADGYSSYRTEYHEERHDDSPDTQTPRDRHMERLAREGRLDEQYDDRKRHDDRAYDRSEIDHLSHDRSGERSRDGYERVVERTVTETRSNKSNRDEYDRGRRDERRSDMNDEQDGGFERGQTYRSSLYHKVGGSPPRQLPEHQAVIRRSERKDVSPDRLVYMEPELVYDDRQVRQSYHPRESRSSYSSHSSHGRNSGGGGRHRDVHSTRQVMLGASR